MKVNTVKYQTETGPDNMFLWYPENLCCSHNNPTTLYLPKQNLAWFFLGHTFLFRQENENEEVSEYEKGEETKIIRIAPFPTLIKTLINGLLFFPSFSNYRQSSDYEQVRP